MAAGKFTLNLNAEVEGTISSLKNYQRRKLPNLVNKALRDTVRALKTEAKRQMSKKVIQMSQGQIGKQIREVPPVAGGHKAKLIFLRKKVSSIASFKFKRQRKISSGKRRYAGAGLVASVWEGSKLYKGSFLWERPGKGALSRTAFHRVKGAAKVVPKKRTGVGGVRRYKRKYTGKDKVAHKKGDIIKRQPIVQTFGTSVAAAFDQTPKKGRKPMRITLAEAGRKIFKQKLQQQIKNLK